MALARRVEDARTRRAPDHRPPAQEIPGQPRRGRAEIARRPGHRPSTDPGINPAKKFVREREALVVSGGVSIVTAKGAIPCSAWSGQSGVRSPPMAIELPDG